MNAVVKEVNRMAGEDRIARIESDVAETKGDIKQVQSDVVEAKGNIKQLELTTRRLESDVTELKVDVKALYKLLWDFKTEVAKEFGSVRAELRGSVESLGTSIESLRTSIERTKVWMLGTGISTVLGVAAIVGFKLH